MLRAVMMSAKVRKRLREVADLAAKFEVILLREKPQVIT